jgi:hypothetical protein
MITLTDKETKLVDYLLANTDGSDGHICSEQFMDLKELGWSMETLKGVFGSLVNKQILFYGDFIEDHNAESYYWNIPVHEERQGFDYISINSVDEFLLRFNQFKEQNKLVNYIKNN